MVEFLLPLLGAIIGAAGGVYVLSRQEWFRRVATWETVSQSLWRERLNYYVEFGKDCQSLLENCTWLVTFHREQLPREKFQDLGATCFKETGSLYNRFIAATFFLPWEVSDATFELFRAISNILNMDCEPDNETATSWQEANKRLWDAYFALNSRMAESLQIPVTDHKTLVRFSEIASEQARQSVFGRFSIKAQQTPRKV